MTSSIRVLLLGKSGRLDALAEAICQSEHKKELFILSDVSNIGLKRKGIVQIGASDDKEVVARAAAKFRPAFAVIGPEEPLAAGIVDELRKMGIPSVGPSQSLARVESSKSFTRELIEEYDIDANPEFRVFRSADGLQSYMRILGEYVIKPDGLTGGKGVRVFGDHFSEHSEGLAYCSEIFEAGGHVVIEEKLDGEEFTFQSFCDGDTVQHMVPVQDHKRLLEGDKGPNTGGMGSYSCANHLLPFLTQQDVDEASEINRRVADALHRETGEGYKGILYGGFIKTRNGLRVIEYNARFGDPEAMNVLPLLQNDFIDVCRSIVDGTLHKGSLAFENKATVCKYVVPNGYPASKAGGTIDLTGVVPERGLGTYYGAVTGDSDECLELTGSRAIAFVGVGETLSTAEQIAERAAASVVGPVCHRRDVGTQQLVDQRVLHMSSLQRKAGVPASDAPPRLPRP